MSLVSCRDFIFCTEMDGGLSLETSTFFLTMSLWFIQDLICCFIWVFDTAFNLIPVSKPKSGLCSCSYLRPLGVKMFFLLVD